MANLVTMINNTTQENEKSYTGFSWTCLFFGFFVPMIRSDWASGLLWFGLYFAAAIVAVTVDPNGGSVGGLLGLIMGFIYNKRHYTRLVAKGFVPTTEA